MSVKNDLIKIIEKISGNDEVKREFIKRIREEKTTRDENSESHFCVFFAPFDPHNHEVFIGHHKKSNLWLFNGGHIDKGELPSEALFREIKEEWGENVNLEDNYEPNFLTITDIYNPTKQPCRRHYDIWYFISLNKSHFKPDEILLEKGFYQAGWKNINEAKRLVTEPTTLSAIEKIEKIFS